MHSYKTKRTVYLLWNAASEQVLKHSSLESLDPELPLSVYNYYSPDEEIDV